MKYEDVQPYINFEAIHPGYIVKKETLQNIVQIAPDKDVESYKKYQLELLSIGQIITSQLDKLNRPYTVVIRKEEIMVLTHAEASKYNQNKFSNGLKKAKRANRKLVHVDVSQLSPAEKERHDAAIIKQSKLVSLIEMGSRPEVKPTGVRVGTRPNPLSKSTD